MTVKITILGAGPGGYVAAIRAARLGAEVTVVEAENVGGTKVMNIFKKDWTIQQSDEWTVHDFLASVFAVLSYFFVTIGIAGTLLAQTWGYVTLAASLVFAWLMFKVIDPKLKKMSKAFEARQQDYLERLEKRVRWEAEDGD